MFQNVWKHKVLSLCLDRACYIYIYINILCMHKYLYQSMFSTVPLYLTLSLQYLMSSILPRSVTPCQKSSLMTHGSLSLEKLRMRYGDKKKKKSFTWLHTCISVPARYKISVCVCVRLINEGPWGLWRVWCRSLSWHHSPECLWKVIKETLIMTTPFLSHCLSHPLCYSQGSVCLSVSLQDQDFYM